MPTDNSSEKPLLTIGLAEGPTIAHACSCHCGALRYTLHCPSLYEPATQLVVACNCSICLKSGYLLVYPSRSGVEWMAGYPEKIKVYRSGRKVADHMLCVDCGSALGVDFKGKIFKGDRLGMNVRMVAGVEVEKLQLSRVDGRNMFTEFNRDW